jgi:hypothetical protein
MPQRLRWLAPVAASLVAVSFVLAQTALAADATVYVTKSGEKYHSASCPYLGKSSVAMPLEKARGAGYAPCSRCQAPPTHEGAESRERASKAGRGRSTSKSKQCAAMTEEGTRCKRKAASGSSYCWQHGRSKRGGRG